MSGMGREDSQILHVGFVLDQSNSRSTTCDTPVIPFLDHLHFPIILNFWRLAQLEF